MSNQEFPVTPQGYEDLKKETEPDVQKELDFWDKRNGKLLTE